MSVFDDLPCGCLRFDDQRTILDANLEAARLLDYPRDRLIGLKLSALLPIASRLFFQSHVFPELVERDQVDEIYLSLQTSVGTEVPVLLSARRVTDGPPAPYACTFLPMHRRHLVERDLIQSRDAADRASAGERAALSQVREIQAQLLIRDRLASIGTLAAGVVHEINNPLTFALGNLELVDEHLAAPAAWPPAEHGEVLRLLAETRDGLERIQSISQSLRSLSRGDDTRPAPVDVAAVLATARRLCGHELKDRVAVLADLPSPAPIVAGHEGRLVQVFLNLLVNAAHAMPSRRPAENCIVVRAHLDGDGMVRVDVEDNGRGMSPAVLARAFDPFFTTKAVGVGTGLGLSVSHGIVTALGGTMQALSVEGEGTVVQMTLPRWTGESLPLAPPAVAPAGASAAPPPAAPATRRVLVADDEAAIGELLKRILRGDDVVTVRDGQAAVDAVRRDTTFDVIFCDVTMPRLTGLEVHDHVRRIAPALASRIVFMTGGAFDAGLDQQLDATGNRRLAKPFTADRVRDLCATVAGRSGAGRPLGTGGSTS